ncbi:putative myo-inositol oxygenase [Lyophyllum shimeji]|uniref:Inositol oxygenase n=1 Tax=Lyophyllum shimeji TaxID=47721 RepID=A0A9P3PUW2_LYOSH|nr:putative myo-inositol oxygenase [Lyophyllum shimeji]
MNQGFTGRHAKQEAATHVATKGSHMHGIEEIPLFYLLYLSYFFVDAMPSATPRELDVTSDAIDEVNVLKGRLWDEKSKFDETKDKTKFRDYDAACDRVKAFYKEQHEKQTVAFNIKARVDFKTKKRARMGVWEAMEMLNTLIDESDPDTSVSQIEHLLQTAEAIRRDGKPEWMQVAGLTHDLGKLLILFGSEGQWDVVGDTFVVGCKFSDKIIYPETCAANPDSYDSVYSTEYGIYKPHCGLDNVMLSWGHDEYLYHVFKDQSTLPPEALAMIRYHSFYPWHREGAYSHLTNEKDKSNLAAVQAFNPYDLYSKTDTPCDIAELRPYYEGLIAKYFPPVLEW